LAISRKYGIAQIFFFSACSAFPPLFSQCLHSTPSSEAHLGLFGGENKVSEEEFRQPHQHHLASINAEIEIDHRDDGNVLIAREL